MYINLILGIVTLAAAWYVLQKLFVREDKPGNQTESLGNTSKKHGDILLEELQKRQDSPEATQAGNPTDIPAARIQPVIEALCDMQADMPAPMRGALAWHDDGPSMRVRISPEGAKAYILAVAWRDTAPGVAHVPRQHGAPSGCYELRHPDGDMEQSEDLQQLLHLLARIIAKKLS